MIKFLLTAGMGLLCLHAAAQTNDTLELDKNKEGHINYIRWKPDDRRTMSNASASIRQIQQAGADNEWRSTQKVSDEIGMEHIRYRQYYKAVPVEEAEFIAHGRNNRLELLNGRFEPVSAASATPSLSEQQALQLAIQNVPSAKFKWEDSAQQKFIRAQLRNPSASYYPKGELVFAKDYQSGDRQYKLAWKFTISSLDPNTEDLVVIDAQNGHLLNKKSLIESVNTPCNAQTRYSGLLGITGDSFTGGFRLRELRNNVTIQTLNVNNGSNYATATDFSNTNTNFTAANWTGFAANQPALDVHWGQEMVTDYWRNTFNRNSIDGLGIPVTGYVHFFIPNSPAGWPNNAQWDNVAHVMRYGDGDGVTFNPITALDVCAHEFGHGINQYTANTSNGTNGATEADALNEGLSDIWGACVEHVAAPNKQNWRIGEEVLRNAFFTCIRDLQNPKSATAAEGQHPDTYLGTFWRADGEPHNNSTVLSHWFYLLSVGGAGTNDLNNAYNVFGIGMDAAQRIVYRAETVYLHAGSTYADARNAMISAARDLNNGVANGCQELAVTNAWYAVGVGNPFSFNPLPVISGPAAVCTTASYTVTGLPAGATVTSWTISPIATVNAAGLVTKVGTGIATLTANLTYGTCGNYTTSINKTITIGLPAPSITVNLTCPEGIAFAAVPAGISPSSFTWHLVDVATHQETINANRGSSIIYKNLIGTHNIGAEYITTCGTSSPGVLFNVFCPGGARLQISPNPSTGNVTVSVNSATSASSIPSATAAADPNLVYEIKVTDQSGNLKKQFTFPAGIKIATLNLGNLVNGSYVLSSFNKVTWESQPLIIAR